MEKRKQLTGIPSSLQSATDPDLDRLLSPAQYFSHPNEVLKSRILDRDETGDSGGVGFRCLCYRVKPGASTATRLT